MNKLTNHFTLSELTHSQTASRLGIDNIPNEEQRESLIDLCIYTLEPIREHFDSPVVISSGFRCKELNDATPGSSSTSQHSEGKAADFTIPGIPLVSIYEWIELHVNFDQLIFEYGEWIHISYNGDKNRKQSLMKRHGVKQYEPFSREVAVNI
jgi:zinc D-Ala-D-Ala carboxypeptidase